MVYLWPCNLKTWVLWQRLQTMWRCHMGGREGLDWSNVVTWLRHAEGMGDKQINKTMHLLHAMEHAALGAWAKQRDEKTTLKPKA